MGRRIGDEVVEIEGRIEHTTEKAYLIEPTIGEMFWLPKSQVVTRTDPDADGNVIFQITEWIAKQNRLI